MPTVILRGARDILFSPFLFFFKRLFALIYCSHAASEFQSAGKEGDGRAILVLDLSGSEISIRRDPRQE